MWSEPECNLHLYILQYHVALGVIIDLPVHSLNNFKVNQIRTQRQI